MSRYLSRKRSILTGINAKAALWEQRAICPISPWLRSASGVKFAASSLSAQVDTPRYPVMLDALQAIFNRYQEDGTVTLEYDTAVVFGQLAV